MIDNVSEKLGLLKEEYAALKREQVHRIGIRDNLLYFMLGSTGAIGAVAATAKAPAALLLLPLAVVVLGWTYLMNDRMITAIGVYLRYELTIKTGEALEEKPTFFGWEREHSGDVRRRQRKLIQLAVDLIAFTVPSLVAVVVFWAMGPASVWLVLLSLVELAAVGVLAWQMWVYAEL